MSYTVEFEHVTLAAASGDIDLFELRPGTAGQGLTLLGFEIDPTTVVQEADEEQWRIRILSMVGGTFTTGTGGATPTPAPTDTSVGDASDFAADTCNTAVATTTGTTRNHFSLAFNARVGTGPIWFPEDAQVFVPGIANVGLLIRLMAAIASDESCSGWACVREGAR